jgi:hypothetical protein
VLNKVIRVVTNGPHRIAVHHREKAVMSTEADPIVGNWYQHLDKGQTFCVVALNEDDGSVEIQEFDGTTEEIDLDTWYGLDVEPAEEPENWTGSLDIAEVDDLGTEITETSVDDWNDPLKEIKAGSEKIGDDWGEGNPIEEPLEGEP